MYRVARHIQSRIGGEAMEEVWFAFDHLKAWSGDLEGRTLEKVDTRGKALLLHFEDGPCIYTHNQLYGRWMFKPAGQRPDTNRQLRLALSSESQSALLYSASEIDVLERGRLDEHPFLARVGLDVLSSGADIDEVADYVVSDAFVRRQLGHLLLDQSFLAGVGNYLRSEILFLSGLDWRRRPGDLDDRQLRRFADAAHTLLWRSVRTEGITNDKARVVALKRAGWKRRDYRHYVFNRDGQVCFECDTPIQRVNVSSRRLYYCPTCQNVPVR
jgi:endonuclease-8